MYSHSVSYQSTAGTTLDMFRSLNGDGRPKPNHNVRYLTARNSPGLIAEFKLRREQFVRFSGFGTCSAARIDRNSHGYYAPTDRAYKNIFHFRSF